MRKLMGMSWMALGMLVLLAGVPVRAQQPPPPPRSGSIYRLDFAIHESEDGKRVNTRSYMIMAEDDYGRNCRIRTGSRVPIVTPGAPGSSVPAIQYMDVGINLDCDLRDRPDGVRLQVTMEISNFAQGQEGRDQPLLRTIRIEAVAALVPGKPGLVSSVDDAASKRRYELEVTATKVK